MWTHRHPYRAPTLSRQSISYYAEPALFRSINTNGAIAFVGSGVSAAYGRLNWAEVARAYVYATREILKTTPLSLNRSAQELLTEILLLTGNEEFEISERTDLGDKFPEVPLDTRLNNEQKLLVVELCERFLVSLAPHDDPNLYRRRLREEVLAKILSSRQNHIKFRRHYIEQEEGQGEECDLDDALKECSQSYIESLRVFQAQIAQHQRQANGKASAAILEPTFEKHLYLLDALSSINALDRGELTNEISSYLNPENGSGSQGGESEEACVDEAWCPMFDPIRILVADLKLNRVLTTNYDVELEKFLRDGAGYNVPFHGLIPPPTQTQNDKLNHREAFTGQGLRGISYSLDDDTVGELVNFATHWNRQEHLIFHLHGRMDAPDDAVVTERDYQERYIRKNELRRGFNEGLQSLFAANAVLFVGVGMNEADLLRPLRQFVSQGESPMSEPRHQFALLPYLGKKEATEQAFWLKLRYDVQAIFFGDAEFEKQDKCIGAVISALSGAIENGKTTGPVDDQTFNQLTKEISNSGWGDLAKRQTRTTVKNRRRPPVSLKPNGSVGTPISDELWTAMCTAEEAANALISKLHKSKQLLTPTVIKALILYFKRHCSDLHTRELCAELTRLSKLQRSWWTDWQASAESRRAVFPHNSKAEQARLWVRHRPEHDTTPKNSEIYKVAKNAGHRLPEANGKKRLLRLTAPRGAGNGAFIFELQENVSGLLKNPDPDTRNEWIFDGDYSYAGAFFANTVYSSEFSSILLSLSRFLAGIIQAEIAKGGVVATKVITEAQDRAWPDLSGEESLQQKYDKEPGDRIVRIRTLLEIFNAVQANRDEGDKKRLLIVLSGLERICDENGRPHSPLHRAFFRLIYPEGDRLYRNEVSQDNQLPANEFNVTSDCLPEVGTERFLVHRLGPTREMLSADYGSHLDIVITTSGMSKPLDILSDIDKLPANNAGEIGQVERVGWTRLPRSSPKQRDWLMPNLDNMKARAKADWIKCCKLLFDQPSKGGAAPRVGHVRKYLDNSCVFQAWLTGLFQHASKALPEQSVFEDWLEQLDQGLSQRGFSGGLALLFDYHGKLDLVEGDRKGGKGQAYRTLRQEILRHVSLFAIPVEREVLLSCPHIQSSLDAVCSTAAGSSDDLEEANQRREQIQSQLVTLVEYGLLSRIRARRGGCWSGNSDGDQSTDVETDWHHRYAVHPQARDFLTRQSGLWLPDQGERNFFEVSLYAAQPSMLPTPSKRNFQLVASVVQNLINLSRSDLQQFYRANPQKQMPEEGEATAPPDDAAPSKKARDIINDWKRRDGERIHAISRRLRAAYSLIHGGFSIGVVSRIEQFETEGPVGDEQREPFEIYRGWLRAILNGAVGINMLLNENSPMIRDADSKDFSIQGTVSESKISKPENPLYCDEITWLYNERGVTSLVQGRIFDALPLFRMAKASTQQLDRIDEDLRGTAEQRIGVNEALAMLEFGQLNSARQQFKDIVSHLKHVGTRESSVTLNVAKGYLGLCAHLSGQMASAKDYYEKTIKWAEDNNRLRALSIFNRHLADLHRLEQRDDDARRAISRAITAAARAEQRDLHHMALIAEARLERRNKDAKDKVLPLVLKAEDYAREMGAPKIRLDALRLRAEVVLSQGESSLAGQLAAEAIAIGRRHGMRLRMIASLVLYGRILQQRGPDQMKTAEQILDQAFRAADTAGYQLKASLARRLIQSV
ncbi:MAG: SIR2 family protein [Alphaproteobacteria bacterium]|nr:SIR2 family protein [Alphaproteobacteria bacterium]